jgi:pimeloyl-ACP methyl ester carboxylesterase
MTCSRRRSPATPAGLRSRASSPLKAGAVAPATRFRHEWLPHADWVELEGVGHCPQLDVPLETAQLVLGVTAS